MSFVVVNSLPYWVEQFGDGPPLLMLHGFTGSAVAWRNLAGAWPYRVIAVDLPGHGRTGCPTDAGRYAIESVAADLAVLLDRLQAIPAHVLGYSMGGRLALYLAVTRPSLIRSLILESASPGLETEEARLARRIQDAALADRIETEGIEAFVTEWESLPLFAPQRRLSPEVRGALRRQRLHNNPHGLAGSLRGMGTGSQPSLWPSLSEVQLPVLLLAGGLDEKFRSINERMAASLPDARLQIMADAGHTTHHEQPAAFQAEVLSFLGRIEAERRSQYLAQPEKEGENQCAERHLLQPGIETGQVIAAADGQTVARQQRDGQQEQKLPGGAVVQNHVGQSRRNGHAQE